MKQVIPIFYMKIKLQCPNIELLRRRKRGGITDQDAKREILFIPNMKEKLKRGIHFRSKLVFGKR